MGHIISILQAQWKKSIFTKKQIFLFWKTTFWYGLIPFALFFENMFLKTCFALKTFFKKNLKFVCKFVFFSHFSPHDCVGFLFFAWIPPLSAGFRLPLAASTSSRSTSHHTPFISHISSPLISHHLLHFSSHTPHLTPLITHHSSHTSHHHSSHTPHLTPLITHRSSHTSHHHSSHTPHLTALISNHSSHTPRISHPSSHSTHLEPLISHISAPLISHPSSAAWAAAAFRVAGAVHRAFWKSCGARGRRLGCGLSCGRRSTQSLLEELRRAWPPLAWAAASFRVAGAAHRAFWRSCRHAWPPLGLRLPLPSCGRRSTQSILQAWPPLGPRPFVCRRSTHRASWRSCGARGRRLGRGCRLCGRRSTQSCGARGRRLGRGWLSLTIFQGSSERFRTVPDYICKQPTDGQDLWRMTYLNCILPASAIARWYVRSSWYIKNAACMICQSKNKSWLRTHSDAGIFCIKCTNSDGCRMPKSSGWVMAPVIGNWFNKMFRSLWGSKAQFCKPRRSQRSTHFEFGERCRQYLEKPNGKKKRLGGSAAPPVDLRHFLLCWGIFCFLRRFCCNPCFSLFFLFLCSRLFWDG